MILGGIQLKLTIKDTAKTYLANRINTTKNLFLATDDGSNKYSKVGGSCAIGDKFQIVATSKQDNDYRIPVDNNQGLHLFTSVGERTFLSSGLTLDFSHNALVLKDDSGILDGAVSVQDVDQVLNQTDAEQTAEQKALSQQIC